MVEDFSTQFFIGNNTIWLMGVISDTLRISNIYEKRKKGWHDFSKAKMASIGDSNVIIFGVTTFHLF